MIPMVRSSADNCSAGILCAEELLLDDAGNLAVAREATGFFLGVHKRAVEDHVEDAVVTLDQLRLHLAGEGLVQFGHQTGGLREIVSANAVSDLDFHKSLNVLVRIAERTSI